MDARLACVAMLLIVSPSVAQQAKPAKPMQLVTSFGPGAIPLPASSAWQPRMISVYDNNRRPVIEFEDPETRVTLSFVLYENLSGKPTAEGCRQDAIEPILNQMGKEISNRVDGEIEDGNGGKLATTSYSMKLLETAHNHDFFAFAGDAKVCAEAHASVVAGKPDEDAVLKAAVAEFHPNLTYQPLSPDFYIVATLLFKRAPEQALPYYEASLESMPQGAVYQAPRRVVTDQLVMSLSRTKDWKAAKAVAQKAIAADPEYPINYYNLACADAETGDVGRRPVATSTGVRSASEPAERTSALPDPTQDPSLLKLKANQGFWSFVQALPQS